MVKVDSFLNEILSIFYHGRTISALNINLFTMFSQLVKLGGLPIYKLADLLNQTPRIICFLYPPCIIAELRDDKKTDH